MVPKSYGFLRYYLFNDSTQLYAYMYLLGFIYQKMHFDGLSFLGVHLESPQYIGLWWKTHRCFQRKWKSSSIWLGQGFQYECDAEWVIEEILRNKEIKTSWVSLSWIPPGIHKVHYHLVQVLKGVFHLVFLNSCRLIWLLDTIPPYRKSVTGILC